MKRIKFILPVLVTTVFLMSCDSNKGKVEELTKQFMNAVNSNDKASLFNLYPDAKSISNMKLPDNILDGDISVEKDDSDKYIVSIENSRQQKLVFAFKGGNEILLEDSYGLFELDSATMELSIKTGVPLKKLSDRYLSTLLDEEGRFITYLKQTYSHMISGGLVFEQGTISWNRAYGGSVYLYQPIRNKSNVTIKGSEYNVEFTFYSISGENGAPTKMVEVGQDLEPNEAITLTVSAGAGYLRACEWGDFGIDKTFAYKNMTPIKSLLKYVKFKGNEYEDYLEALPKIEETFAIRELYHNVVQRKLTEEDLKDISKDELKKLRNTIYAVHGYIFGDKKLAEYFNSCKWYQGTTTDMNKVSAEFSDVEKYNVEFIKQHETK